MHTISTAILNISANVLLRVGHLASAVAMLEKNLAALENRYPALSTCLRESHSRCLHLKSPHVYVTVQHDVTFGI